MSYTFRSVPVQALAKASGQPFLVSVDTPKEYSIKVCTAEDSRELREAFAAVYQAAVKQAKRDIRDALGVVQP